MQKKIWFGLLGRNMFLKWPSKLIYFQIIVILIWIYFVLIWNNISSIIISRFFWPKRQTFLFKHEIVLKCYSHWEENFILALRSLFNSESYSGNNSEFINENVSYKTNICKNYFLRIVKSIKKNNTIKKKTYLFILTFYLIKITKTELKSNVSVNLFSNFFFFDRKSCQ